MVVQRIPVDKDIGHLGLFDDFSVIRMLCTMSSKLFRQELDDDFARGRTFVWQTPADLQLKDDYFCYRHGETEQVFKLTKRRSSQDQMKGVFKNATTLWVNDRLVSSFAVE